MKEMREDKRREGVGDIGSGKEKERHDGNFFVQIGPTFNNF